MEPDAGTTVSPTLTVSNAVAWDAAAGGFNFDRAGNDFLLEHLVAHTRAGGPCGWGRPWPAVAACCAMWWWPAAAATG